MHLTPDDTIYGKGHEILSNSDYPKVCLNFVQPDMAQNHPEKHDYSWKGHKVLFF